ncbi:MAG: calcium-binding protein [Oscillospiraceae bacterium]|nr:calcium-binding protein [Oscillospiraceae bacterium]
MDFNKEEVNKLEFSVIENEEGKEKDDEDICRVCGSNSGFIVGYNEKEQIYKYECKNCGAITAVNSDGEEIFLKGEERDWVKYLSENLEFPFMAEITEMSDREIFNPDDPGPICYMDIVKVLEVIYSFKYGVEAVIKKGRKKYTQILCFMEAVDSDSRNYVEIENYKRWRDIYWKSDYLTALIDGFKGK